MKKRIPSLMTGAEPFFYTGNTIGCMVLHGLTASPDEVRWFGEHLAERGFTVYGPRLTGHGTDYREMSHIHWHDWYLDALDGYLMLRRHCQKVFVCGLSMGGLLALLLAAGEQVDGLVVMAAPVQAAQHRMLNLATLLKYVRPYFDASDKSDFPQRLIEEQKQRGEQARGRVRYDRWAYSGVDALYNLMKTVDTHLPGVQEPTLLMYSTADKTVPYSNLAYIQQRIGSTVLETATFESSGHIMTQDMEHMAVFQRAGDFIEQQAALTIINK